VSFSVWWTLFAAAAVISLTPGAGAVNTMANSMNQGWRRSFWGIVGQQIALIIQVVIVAVGVGSVVAAFPVVLEVVRWLGAAYLVFLGVRMMLARPQPTPEVEHRELSTSQVPVVDRADTRSASDGHGPGATHGSGPTRKQRRAPDGERRESVWAMIRRGILVNLSNPKAIVFFLAFIPPFIDPDRGAALQYVIIGATCVGVDILVMWFGFAALSRPLARFTGSERGQRILNLGFGCCFILVAALLLLTH
jgi:homoserine/homoserine lactone efflux protein